MGRCRVSRRRVLFLCTHNSARSQCPFIPGVQKRLHWSSEDPSRGTGTEEERLATFRKVRDQIETRIADWLDRR